MKLLKFIRANKKPSISVIQKRLRSNSLANVALLERLKI